MKKFSCILLLLACVFSIVSCSAEHNDTNNTNEYVSYVTDTGNDGLTFVEKNFFDDSDISKEDVEKTKEIVFEDCLYQLTYSDHSNYHVQNGLVIDRYKQDRIKIYICRDTGKVGAFVDPSVTDDENLSKPDVEKTDLRKKFEELAIKYIDVEQYRYFENEKENSGSNGMKLYSFSYIKYIDGYETGDAFSVEFTSKGDIRAIGAYGICFYDDKDINIDKDKLKESVESKLEEIYSKHGEYTVINQHQALIALPTGELAIRSLIDIHLKDCDTGIVITTIIPEE